MFITIRRLSISVLFVCFIVQVIAQNTLDLVGLGNGTPYSASFSLRKLSSSYTGPLVRIQITGINNFFDVYPDVSSDKNISSSSAISAVQSTFNTVIATASAIALSSIITSGTTNSTLVTLYDQSGNGNHATRDNTSYQPALISSGTIPTINGIPTLLLSAFIIVRKFSKN